MTVLQEAQKKLSPRIAELARRSKRKHIILIDKNGESVTWGSFRYMQLMYGHYPPEFGTREPFLERIVLVFTRCELSIPVLPLLESAMCIRSEDSIEAMLLQPIKQMYAKFETAFVTCAQPATNGVPVRLKLQWTRRLAVEFAWEGRLLTLKARQAGIQELLDVAGASLSPVHGGASGIARDLVDTPDQTRIKSIVDHMLGGKPGDWWFEADLPNRAAEELRRVWLRRYRYKSLRNAVASWAAPGAFVLAVFLEAYLDELRTGGVDGRVRKHLRVALEAHRRQPRAELLFNLGQAAYRLNLDRTAWYLLLKSARSLPAGSPKQVLQYHYSPSLLSILGDLARKAGAVDTARQFDTWFEERVLASGTSDLPTLLSSLGIASE